MEQRDGVAALLQLPGDLLRPELGASEDDPLLLVGLDDEGALRPRRRAHRGGASERRLRGAGVPEVDDLGVTEHALGEGLDLLGHGRGEEHRLALLRDSLQDPAHVREEPHVEQPVRLVEHQHLELRQGTHPLTDEVEEPSGARDEHVAARLQRGPLAVDLDAAVRRGDPQGEVAPERFEVALDLPRELPRRREDEGPRVTASARRSARPGIGRAGRGLPGPVPRVSTSRPSSAASSAAAWIGRSSTKPASPPRGGPRSGRGRGRVRAASMGSDDAPKGARAKCEAEFPRQSRSATFPPMATSKPVSWPSRASWTRRKPRRSGSRSGGPRHRRELPRGLLRRPRQRADDGRARHARRPRAPAPRRVPARRPWRRRSRTCCARTLSTSRPARWSPRLRAQEEPRGDGGQFLQTVRTGTNPHGHGHTPPKDPFEHGAPKLGRNDPCSCGSGKKYKKCHGRNA